MECHAKVIKAERRKALVRVARVNCAECGGCGLLARNREHTMEFNAVDHLGVRDGDEVLLEVPSRRLSLSYLTVFGLPLLAMAAAYLAALALYGLAGGADGQGIAVLAAVIAGLIALWGGAKLAHRMGLSPAVKEIIRTVDECGVSSSGEADEFKGKVL
jgi:positive regulator of sigma E activity